MTHTVQYTNQRSIDYQIWIVETVHSTQMLKGEFTKNTWKINYSTGDRTLHADKDSRMLYMTSVSPQWSRR